MYVTAETAQELHQAIAAMEQHAARVNMEDWCTDDDFTKLLAQSKACGTVGCLAGFILGLHERKELKICYSVDAADLAGLTQAEAYKLFYTNNWPRSFSKRLWETASGTSAYVQIIKERVEHFIATGE